MITYVRILSMLCLMAALLFGCAPENTAPKEVSPSPQAEKISYTERVKQTSPAPQYNKTSQDVSNRLEQIAKQMPHVKDATAVSIGNYSVVGLDLEGTLDRGEVGTVKYSVAEALHKDPVGARALVTADTDLVQRIRNIRQDIRQGQPVSSILQEIAGIAERITPQPTKVTPKQEKTATD